MNSGTAGERLVAGRPYVPGIDGLRALAVLSVMVYHLVPQALPGGFSGVDVFFVISGYVVTGSLVRDAQLPFGRFIAAFYARRFKRIVPALVVCLVVTVLLNAALVPDAWLSEAIRSTALSAFFGFSNFVLVSTSDGYFAPRSEFNPFTHTWSLAVEEQFYLLFPLLAYLQLGGRDGPRPRWAGALFVALALASLAWSVWITPRQPDHAYYLLPSRFWELAVGAGLHLLGPAWRATQVRRFGQARLIWLGLGLVLLSMLAADKRAFPWPWALPAVAGSALIILVLSAPTDPHCRASRWLASAPMVRIGLWSYSLYLWHWPVYTLMRWTVGLHTPVLWTVALAMTVLLAGLSYRFVEQPVARSAPLLRWPALAVVVLGCSVVVLARATAQQVFERPHVFKRTVVAQRYTDWYPVPAAQASPLWAELARCSTRSHRIAEGLEIVPQACAAGPLPTPVRLFVLGDSHASAAHRVVDAVARITGWTVRLHARGGCPVAGLLRPAAAMGPACTEHQRTVVDEVLRVARPGDRVLLTSLQVRRLGDQDGPLAPPGDADRLAAARARAAALAEADATIQRLEDAGLVVVIDQPKPVFPSPPFRCSDPFNRTNPVCAGGLSLSRDAVESHRRDALLAVAALVARHPSLRTWDSVPLLCSAQACSAIDADGRPLFFDGDHLSGHGNDRLVRSLLAVLDPAPG